MFVNRTVEIEYYHQQCMHVWLHERAAYCDAAADMALITIMFTDKVVNLTMIVMHACLAQGGAARSDGAADVSLIMYRYCYDTNITSQLQT